MLVLLMQAGGGSAGVSPGRGGGAGGNGGPLPSSVQLLRGQPVGLVTGRWLAWATGLLLLTPLAAHTYPLPHQWLEK